MFCYLITYKDNYTALHLAVESGQHEVVETLLGEGANVHIRGKIDRLNMFIHRNNKIFFIPKLKSQSFLSSELKSQNCFNFGIKKPELF